MNLHEESGSNTEIDLSMGHGGLPWVADIKDPNFEAGRQAIQQVLVLLACVYENVKNLVYNVEYI